MYVVQLIGMNVFENQTVYEFHYCFWFDIKGLTFFYIMSTVLSFAGLEHIMLASFLGLPSDQKLEPGKAWERGYIMYLSTKNVY